MPETPCLPAPHTCAFGPVSASLGNSGEKGAAQARDLSTAQGQVKNEVEGPCAVGWHLPLVRVGGFLWTSLEPWTRASLGSPGSAAAHIRVTLDLGSGQAFSLIVLSILSFPWLCDFCLDPLPNGGFLGGPAVSHWASALNRVPGL